MKIETIIFYLKEDSFWMLFWAAFSAIGTVSSVAISLFITIRDYLKNSPQNWLKVEKAFLSVFDYSGQEDCYKLKFFALLRNEGNIEIKIKKAKLYFYIKKFKKVYLMFFCQDKQQDLLRNEVQELSFSPLREKGLIQSSFDSEDFIKNIKNDLKTIKKSRSVKANVIFDTNVGAINYDLNHKEIERCISTLNLPCLEI